MKDSYNKMTRVSSVGLILKISLLLAIVLPVSQAALATSSVYTSTQQGSTIEHRDHTVYLTAFQRQTAEKKVNTPSKAFDDTVSRDIMALSGSVRVPVDSPEPFLAVTARWPSSGTTESPITVELNSSDNGTDWGEWVRVPLDDNTSENTESFMGELLFFDRNTEFVRYRITVENFPDDSAELPASLTLTFISPGATPQENLQAFLDMYEGAEKKAAWWEKPPVVSRTFWGCPDGQDSRWTPAYTTVSHLVVHHTAGSNYASDWPAVVRSIWSYHALTRGWGDIGYNYLIDPNGVIFEGRAGGENAIGAHFSGHNSGTMGVSIMGTYISISPSTAALGNLSEILSWKCSESSIDPLGISFHASSQLTLYNICGHRDGGNTECPGQRLYDLLPSIREEVAIGAPLVSPLLITPEYSAKNQHVPIEFTWNEVYGAAGYRLYVSNSLTGWNSLDGFYMDSIVYDSGTLPGNSTTHLWTPSDPGVLQPAKIYYWSVQSEGENGPGFATSPFKFITGLTAAETFKPELTIVDTTPVIRFEWGEVERATHYRIMVSQSDSGFDPDYGFPDPVLDVELRSLVYEWDNVEEETEYFWSVKARHTSGFESRFSAVRSFTTRNGVVGVYASRALPFSLGHNHPNPFNPSTTIDFSLTHESTVNLSVLNSAGQLVTTLISGQISAGYHSVVWNAAGMPSGIYIYRLTADDFIDMKKMMLIK